MKLSGKHWNGVTGNHHKSSNILLDELFGQLSMESDGSGSKHEWSSLDTERSTSLPTRTTNANLANGGGAALDSSLEVQNGSRQNSYSTNAYVFHHCPSIHPMGERDCYSLLLGVFCSVSEHTLLFPLSQNIKSAANHFFIFPFH